MRKRRRMRHKLKIILSLILLFSLLLGGYFIYRNDLLRNNDKPIISDNKKSDNIAEEPKEKIYTATILGTGDALAHTNVFNSALKDGGGKKYDFTHAFSKIKDIVSSYDIAYYNQETIFAGENYAYTGYPRFNTPSAFGDYLVDTGFNTVSTATNHTIDKGEKGIINAYNYWITKDVMFNGIADSEENRNKITLKEVNNISYALLSYTTSTNGLPVPKGKSYLVNLYSDEQVKKDVESIRDKVDVLIVAIHWGSEYTHNPTKFQREKAKYLASLNVDIVFGTHPHVIQPIEKIDDTFIYYSLGNFISNQEQLPRKIGMFATLKVTKIVNETGTNITINDNGTELLYVYNKPNHTKHIVIPFSKLETQYLKDYKTVYETYKKVLLRYDNSFIINPINS